MADTFEVPTDGFAKELVERTAQGICMQSHRKKFEVTLKEKLRSALQTMWFRSGKDRALKAADSAKSHSHMYLELKDFFNDPDFAQPPERQPTQKEVYDALPAELKAMAGPYLHKAWEDMSTAVRVDGPDNVEDWNGNCVDNVFKITIMWEGAVDQQLKEWEGTPKWDEAVAAAKKREREEKRRSWERMREWHKSCHSRVDWSRRRDPWEPSTPTEEDMIMDANAQTDAAEDHVSEQGDEEGYNRVDPLPSLCERYEIIFAIEPCHLHPKGVPKICAEVLKGNGKDILTVNAELGDERFLDSIDRKDVVGWKRPRPDSPDPEDVRAFNARW